MLRNVESIASCLVVSLECYGPLEKYSRSQLLAILAQAGATRGNEIRAGFACIRQPVTHTQGCMYSK